MDLKITQQQGSQPVSVIHLEGTLDSNSYQFVIDQAKKLFVEGSRRLILDMTALTYISSAGIVALQSIAKLFRGESLLNTEAGWNTIRSLDKERSSGKQQNVKLLNVPANVQKVLDTVGISEFFEIYSDLAAAVASFQ